MRRLLLTLASALVATTCAFTSSASATVTCSRTLAVGGSVQAFIDTLQPGETGCLRGGTHTYSGIRWNHGGVVGAPITLTSYPGERALLRGGQFYVPAGSDDITLDALDFDGRSAGANSIPIQLFGNRNRLLNSDVTNSHMSGSCITLSDYGGGYPTITGAEIRGNHIHGCGLLSNGAHDHGIYVANTTGHVVSDNVIEDIEAGWAIQLWTTSVNGVFERNTLRASSVVSSSSEGGVAIVAGSGTHGNVFRNNTLVSKGRPYVVDAYQDAADAARFSDNCIVGAGAPLWESTSLDGGGNRTVASESDCGTAATPPPPPPPPPAPPPPPPPPTSWVDITNPADGATITTNYVCPTANASADTGSVKFTMTRPNGTTNTYTDAGAPWVGTCWNKLVAGVYTLRVDASPAGASDTVGFRR